jgi:hypothetical protein
MTDLGLYAAAWRDRRRRMIIFKCVQIAFFPAVLLAAILPRRYASSFLAVFVVWFLLYLATGVWLNRFRCPRCGKLYYWRLERKGYMDRQRQWRDCRYCGLHQDAEPGY